VARADHTFLRCLESSRQTPRATASPPPPSTAPCASSGKVGNGSGIGDLELTNR
jgi:hypothetical protein